MYMLLLKTKRKKVTKIFGQINRIAQKGKDYTLDYHKLIDEIVTKGDYAHLEICLSDKYNLDPTKYRSVDELKTKNHQVRLWKEFRFSGFHLDSSRIPSQLAFL